MMQSGDNVRSDDKLRYVQARYQKFFFEKVEFFNVSFLNLSKISVFHFFIKVFKSID